MIDLPFVEFSLEERQDNENDNAYLLNSLNKPKHVFACSCTRCKRYCRNRIDLDNILRFNDVNLTVLKAIMVTNGLMPTSMRKLGIINLIWLSSMPKISIFSSLRKYQKINHFPHSHLITKKDELYKNYLKMRELFGEKHFNYIPKTYVLPLDREEFVEDYHKSKNGHPLLQDKLWILKPCNKACGKGIKIFPSLHAIDLSKKRFENNLVVSQYISNPFLLDGNKFDIRVYVLVTSIEPLKIYIYNDCLFRVSTEKFTKHKDLLSNEFIHLTNTFVQKHHRKYQSNENFADKKLRSNEPLPNKLSLLHFQQLIQETQVADDINLSEVFVDIEDISIKTILSMETKVRATLDKLYQKGLSRRNCFQLFGFDFLLSKEKTDTKVWLIEVNGSPSLNLSSKLDEVLKSEMICELLNIVGVNDIDFEKFDIQRHLGYVCSKAEKAQSVERPKFLNDCDINSESAREHEFKRKANLKHKLKQTILGEKKRSKNWKLIFPTRQSEKYHNFFEEPSDVHQMVFEIFRNPNIEST